MIIVRCSDDLGSCYVMAVKIEEIGLTPDITKAMPFDSETQALEVFRDRGWGAEMFPFWEYLQREFIEREETTDG